MNNMKCIQASLIKIFVLNVKREFPSMKKYVIVFGKLHVFLWKHVLWWYVNWQKFFVDGKIKEKSCGGNDKYVALDYMDEGAEINIWYYLCFLTCLFKTTKFPK